MIKLNIERALLDFEEKTGKRMKKKELAAAVWPKLSEGSRITRLSNLIHGKTKRVELSVIKRLCEVLRVGYDYMIGN